MGFFGSSPRESQQKAFKKVLKRADLSGQQQKDFLEKLEEVRQKHGSDSYRADHIKETVRHLKGTTGDSLQESQIDRAARHLHEHLEAGVAPWESVKPEIKPMENLREYHGLDNDSLEVPKPAEPREPQEPREGGMDKAA